jgi:hypothetical protein
VFHALRDRGAALGEFGEQPAASGDSAGAALALGAAACLLPVGEADGQAEAGGGGGGVDRAPARQLAG